MPCYPAHHMHVLLSCPYTILCQLLISCHYFISACTPVPLNSKMIDQSLLFPHFVELFTCMLRSNFICCRAKSTSASDHGLAAGTIAGICVAVIAVAVILLSVTGMRCHLLPHSPPPPLSHPTRPVCSACTMRHFPISQIMKSLVISLVSSAP